MEEVRGVMIFVAIILAGMALRGDTYDRVVGVQEQAQGVLFDKKRGEI